MINLTANEHKYYDLSTGHIPFSDSEILTTQSENSSSMSGYDLVGIRVFWYPEGFFLSIDTPSYVNFEKVGLSDALWIIVRSAIENNVQMIRLDRDEIGRAHV